MGLIAAFPPSPLTHADIVRIRSREEVEVFTVVGSASFHTLRSRNDEPATHAVALVGGTVYGFAFEGSSWSEHLLRRDADRQAHLEATLEWMATG